MGGIKRILYLAQMHAESKMWDERLVEPEGSVQSACESTASVRDAEQALQTISRPALPGEI